MGLYSYYLVSLPKNARFKAPEVENEWNILETGYGKPLRLRHRSYSQEMFWYGTVIHPISLWLDYVQAE
ncbi:MAG: hypothetical protein JETT_0296 [Candidatus Jettenia ecosi]|uniref:Uncharacterized protein n=1 Tax=Candidatus Jettenia ecosi TaxID=2494326 RepID=A0A533QFC2_9BACT|nr:MAG: hypothetical protein JETT_0296 [Candidatus Jettenia ecosi]